MTNKQKLELTWIGKENWPGLSRVIAMCREAGVEAPTFQEIGPAALVTFRVRVGSTAEVASAPSRPQVSPKSRYFSCVRRRKL